LNSTTDPDANVTKLTISLASAYPNLYSPLAEIDFGIKQPIDPVGLGPTFNSPSTCVIISNVGTLHYSALETFTNNTRQSSDSTLDLHNPNQM
jgi:hypothetical protein